MLFVNAHLRAERLSICQGCEHYVEKTRSCGPLVKEAFTDSPLCGCHMPTKTRLKTASCPLGKWEATITSKDVDQIREFLTRDNKLRTTGELTMLANKYLGAGKAAGSCGPCNSKLMKELETLVKNADSQT
jgi:hypothetical protein